MIISASRRTDIPAFYGEWLMNRLEAGYCEVANPFNPKQVSRVSLVPEDVDALVFWTRYPRTLIDHLEPLRRRGYPSAFLYTLVDYPKDLEPAAPPLESRLEAFRRLVEICGRDAVVWRYDPIIITNQTPPAYHRERFAAIADALSGYIGRVIVSLLQPYRSVMRALAAVPELDVADHTEPTPEIRDLLRDLARDAADRGIAVQSCADPRLSPIPGIHPGACISEELLRAVGAAPAACRAPAGRPPISAATVGASRAGTLAPTKPASSVAATATPRTALQRRGRTRGGTIRMGRDCSKAVGRDGCLQQCRCRFSRAALPVKKSVFTSTVW